MKGVSIAGAEEVIVRSIKEVHELLRRGAEKRRTATTLMNMTSRFFILMFIHNYILFILAVLILSSLFLLWWVFENLLTLINKIRFESLDS